MQIFRVKSEKIYTGQKKFTRAPLVVLVTNIRYDPSCPFQVISSRLNKGCWSEFLSAPKSIFSILTRPSTLGGGKHELTSWQVNMWIHCPRYRRWYDPNAGSTQEWQVYTFCGYDVTGERQIAIEIEKQFLCSMLKTAQQGVTSTFIPSKQRRP